MNLFFYTFLFIFWTMFGSFASVIIYRLKSKEWGIMAGRSHCKTCVRNLTALELIPIFSWLFQWWKCKWCKQKISSIYPLLELATGILFVTVGIFLIDPNLIFAGNVFEWIRMFFFAALMFLTVIYVFYDILYLEIPESILLIANIWVFGTLVAQGFWYAFIPYLLVWGFDFITLLLCLTIIGSLYYIMLAGLKDIWDILVILWNIWLLAAYFILYVTYNFYAGNEILFSALLSGTIAALGVFISFYLQILLSGWRAMGQGDLRIALLMWMLTWISFAFPAWMLCYIVWSVIWIFLIIKFKIKSGLKSGFNHQIPFGPFIASWYLCVLFFFSYISKFIEWYL